ncbi:transketolase [Propioniciclava tarda]|uniref:Transketolase n=1 Tax=Propioniciclava tarda TaxID=433330 RepID=A0A4Q9KIS4_PROTD|nr:transketolase [Propioniciclava tarda]TBT94322.1 transketolase [Propioniciclava tarda]SMO74031.1 transketolase [Propioniciclava tarda]
MTELVWTELDKRAVDTARVLAADAVQKVGNGHPGTAISLAPVAYLLYQKVMNVDPSDDRWLGRDIFVLSAGHSSLTQYTQLYLGGLGLELTDIEALRTWGSKTPGHPEVHHTKFIECTTGPLGAGISNAVGFAMAARRERELYDPSAEPGTSVFDHFVYTIAGDGCMQEGVASEASSLAATQNLGNLILIYDDNRISIEGDTKISFSEDVEARYAAYGWHTQHVDFTNGFTTYEEKVGELYAAIEAAKAVTDRPSFIKVTTIIGWPLPTKAGDHSVHGSALGAPEIAALKTELGMDPDKSFDVAPEVVAHTRDNVATRAKTARADWDARFAAWRQANPTQAALLDRVRSGRLPEDAAAAVAAFPAGTMSTRKASGLVLTALGKVMPELWGGSADLASSNNTTIEGAKSFLPEERGSHDWTPGSGPDARVLHFGIREHAMGGIVNAINLTGLTRCYGGTFLVFSDYMRPTARLAALSDIPSTFVWTHDSIGVGEDGPTHQPIEHVASLRLIPGFNVVRPADANETTAAWLKILADRQPAGIILSRQDLTTFDRTSGQFAGTEGVAKGGYTLAEASAEPKVVLVATGSEVEIAVAAREALEAEGVPTRVVSMPCVEWFLGQDEAYRSALLPDAAAKVSVEAGTVVGWKEILGCKSASVGLDHFGASASGALLYEKFGITADAVVAKAKGLLG